MIRLHPPAAISVRKTAEDFDFAGRRVRTGTTVSYSPYATHPLPEVWPDPLRFAPERWDPATPGYGKPSAHEFPPFGEGPHRRIGATLATTELTVMLARLTARASLTLTTRRVRPIGVTAMRPRGGVMAQGRGPAPRIAVSPPLERQCAALGQAGAGFLTRHATQHNGRHILAAYMASA